MTDRMPPQDVEIESSIIGSCIMSKDALYRSLEDLTIEDFWLDSHRIIYQAIIDLHNSETTIDTVILTNLLKDRGVLEKIGGAKEIVNIYRNCIPVNIHHYILKLKEYSGRRKAITLGHELIEKSYDTSGSITDVIETMSSNFNNIIIENKESCFHVKDILNRKSERNECIKTGLNIIDQWLYGLFRQELTIIAARPSLGKTSLAMNIAEKVAVDKNVLFYSLEMPSTTLVYRMISSRTGVSVRKLQTDYYTEFEKVEMAKAQISKLNLLIDDEPNINIDKFVIKTNRLSKRVPLDLIVVDYVQLMSNSIKGNRDEKLSDISRKVKGVARSCNCPLLELSQLNRSVDGRPDPQPRLSDLRESGALEQDADGVLFIWQYMEGHQNYKVGTREITAAKQRNGPTGTFTMLFDETRTLFQDYRVESKKDIMDFIHD